MRAYSETDRRRFDVFLSQLAFFAAIINFLRVVNVSDAVQKRFRPYWWWNRDFVNRKCMRDAIGHPCVLVVLRLIVDPIVPQLWTAMRESSVWVAIALR